MRFGLVLGATYTYKDTDYTPEGYIDGKKKITEKYTADELESNPKLKTVTQDSYYYSYAGLMANTIGNTTLGEILFEQTLEADRYGKPYWLASPGALVDSNSAYFGPGFVANNRVAVGGAIFGSFGGWSVFKYAVRPIVILNSSVTINQVQKTTGSTTQWNYDNGYIFVESGDSSNGQAGANLGTPIQ